MGASQAVNQTPVPEAHDVDPIVDAARYLAAVRLMESLLHDVRNPLNALAINAEVLMEKLRDDTGVIPPGQEKNLRAIREQVQRVDGVLRLFAQFIAPPKGPSEMNLTDWVRRSLDVLGHESRRNRVRVTPTLAEDVRLKARDVAAVSFLLMRVLLRGIERTAGGEELSVALTTEPGVAVLTVRDRGGAELQPDQRALLDLLAERAGAELRLRDGELRLAIPWS